ncbi:MAG TPA: hypothetical protein PKM21_07105 [Anaerolineales bacterium]|nr:hypothetical protein [Anaerolineales bacterium]
MKTRFRKVLLYVFLGLTLLCTVAAAISALTNIGLPTHSQVTERLSELEKARLAETIHLRQELGDAVWPGWGQADIPIIVYNEEYAFLVGYPDPPDGWLKMPRRQARGGAWEPVPGDIFQGQVYYRQQLAGPNLTPENYTVLVGERWVATMETKEYMEIKFYADIRQQIPPFLQEVFPYRLVWGFLVDETENYIGGLEHESFHALQGSLAGERLAEAEYANQNESQYPWDDTTLDKLWQQEMDLLVQAVQADTTEQAAELGRQFLVQRDARRAETGLSQELIDYERQREWLEGLAKYAELVIGRSAGATSAYTYLPALEADPDFNAYATRQRYWEGQIGEAQRTTGRSGGTCFYYSGFAQAVLLDRLLPGWQTQAFEPGVMLEDLLRQALGQ